MNVYIWPIKGILRFMLVHADRLTPIHISGVCIFFVCVCYCGNKILACSLWRSSAHWKQWDDGCSPSIHASTLNTSSVYWLGCSDLSTVGKLTGWLLGHNGRWTGCMLTGWLVDLLSAGWLMDLQKKKKRVHVFQLLVVMFFILERARLAVSPCFQSLC